MAVTPRNTGQDLGRKCLQDGAPIGQEILGHGLYECEKLGVGDALSIVSDDSSFVLMPEGMPTSIVDNIIIAGHGMKLGLCFGQARAGTSHRLHLVPSLVHSGTGALLPEVYAALKIFRNCQVHPRSPKAPCRACSVGAATGLAAGHTQQSGIWQTTKIS